MTARVTGFKCIETAIPPCILLKRYGYAATGRPGGGALAGQVEISKVENS